MKTPLSHRFVGSKKDISGHFGGWTTACKFPSLVHGNIHDDFLQFAGGTGRENRINPAEGKFAGFGTESCGKALDLSRCRWERRKRATRLIGSRRASGRTSFVILWNTQLSKLNETDRARIAYIETL
jgi:hypothetical protein